MRLWGAVGAAGAVNATVALAVAVAPEALVAVIVNVVVALIATVVEPDVPTTYPLITALAALVVDQVTRALLFACRTAVMVAVGPARSIVTSVDGGPYLVTRAVRPHRRVIPRARSERERRGDLVASVQAPLVAPGSRA